MTRGALNFVYIKALIAVFAACPVHGANPAVSSVLLVKASDVSDAEAHCVLYVPAIKDIAKREADAEYLPLLNVLNDTECDYERRSFEGKVVLMEHCDNTSNDDIIQKAKSAKAAAIVVTYNEKRPIAETSTDIKKLDIVVAFAKNSTGRQIAHYEEKHANGTVMAKLFTRSTALDWSFAIIWLIAVGTVTLGAYWSGIAQCGRYKQKVAQPVRTRSRPKRISRRLRRPSEPDRKPALPGHHVRHGIRSCTDFLSGATRQPHQRREIEGASTGGSVLSDAHGSQDLLGVAFCINMLKSIHLPNLKLLSLLLMLLLVYDVFFVFITPFLRVNRESVMVEVAKGSGVREVLPMVIKFPRIYRSGYSKCFQMKFSILGLGDILAPGMLISYCHTFDLFALGRRFYFYIACVSYGLGMVATFLALELMRNAQPALLYLVPFTIIPTITTAWSKGDLFAIWNGVKARMPPMVASPS
nr:signal peptide peptidase-like 2B [Rhipicephalus microplus]